MSRFLMAATISSLMALTATGAEPVDAVWTSQEITFVYVSVNVAYSCDVMASKIETLMRHVGSADDVVVTIPPCPGGTRPQRRHRITVEFSTLVPATDGELDVVKAAWSEVELRKRNPISIDDGDCELLEHFMKYLLPTIDHEVVDGKVGCSADRYSIVGRLKLKVLEPVVEDVSTK